MGAAFGKDLTEGSIPKHLLLFSIPVLAGNALQIGYSLINTIWVGTSSEKMPWELWGSAYPSFMYSSVLPWVCRLRPL